MTVGIPALRADECTEEPCGFPPPSISISPGEGTYTVSNNNPINVNFVATISDADSIVQSSAVVRFNNAVVTGWTWQEYNVTTGKIAGTVTLSGAGEHLLEVQASDRWNNVGTGGAVFRVVITDPRVPIVDTSAHHNAFRDTTLGRLGLSFSTAAYVSLDTPRSVTLKYSSEHASPSGYVQLDAQPDPRTAADVVAMSLRLTEDATGTTVGREYFWARHASAAKQRMGVAFSMRGRATGAYAYTATVRSYFRDNSYSEKKVPVRVLILNETASRYGAGWSIAGVQRLYTATGGVVLHEGDGVLRWFSGPACNSGSCTFETPEGDFTSLTYDSATQTYTRTAVDGSLVRFNGSGLMTASVDPFGRQTTLAWQNVGSPAVPVLSSITDPVNKIQTLEYTASGYLRAISDPVPRQSTFTINAPGDLTTLAASYVMQVVYDAGHISRSHTDEHGTWDTAFYRGALSGVTTPGVPIHGLTGLVRLTTKYRRAEWKTTLLSAEGTSVQDPAPALLPGDAADEVVDPRGHTTLITRNRYGQPLSTTELDGKVTGYSYYSNGLPQTIVANNGSTRAFVWTAHGRPLVRYVDGDEVYRASYTRNDVPDWEDVGGTRRWYSWGTRGEMLRSWHGAQTDATLNGTTYEYDSLYRPAKVVGPKGERSEWTYGQWGNVYTESSVRDDGAVISTTYSYDTKGLTYGVRNADGQLTITNHDFRNRLTEITDPDGKVTKIGYTGDRPVQLTDRAGKVFGFAYNALGWLQAETVGGKTRSRTYDADGLLMSQTDRRGLTVRFTYDTAHRPLTRVADGATTSYTYPDHYSMTASNPEGTFASSVHHATGHLDAMRMTIAGLPGRTYELKNVLDLMRDSRPIGTDVKIYANGVLQQTESVRVEPLASADGGGITITDPRGGLTRLTYDTAGNLTQTIFPNGVTQRHFFSTDRRLLETSYTSSAIQQSLGAGFTYDLFGRLTRRTSNVGKSTWDYTYDVLGQLESYLHQTSMPPVNCNPHIQTCSPVWQTVRNGTYTFDPAGNRTDAGSVITPGTNQYSSFAGYALTYDAEGNLIRKSKSGFDQRLTWNTLGQLTCVVTNGAEVTFGYDALGRRIRRADAGATRYFIWDNDDVLLELGPDGSVSRSYTHLPGVDQPLSVRENHPGYQSVHYYVLERPGHVRALLDEAGAVAGEYNYLPFGEPIPTAKGDGTNQPLRFMARELDPAAKLYYVRNRWYDPELGRFISEDPIGIAGGINTYAYLENDPLNGRDPQGLMQEEGTICDTMPWLNMCIQGVLLETFWMGTPGAYDWDMPIRTRELGGGLAIFGGINPYAQRDVTGIQRIAEPVPPPRQPSTIGPPTPDPYGLMAAKRAKECRFFRTQALIWGILHSSGRVVAGATEARQNSTFHVSVGLRESQGTHFGNAQIHLNQGKSPRFDSNWSRSMATNYAEEARNMAAVACRGVNF